MKKRTLTDPAGLWNRTSLPNRMSWLIKSKVHESKLSACLQLKWEHLPFEVQVAIGII